MVPTFTFEPFDGVGAQLCPCNLVTVTPQAFTMTSYPTITSDIGVTHQRWVCAATRP